MNKVKLCRFFVIVVFCFLVYNIMSVLSNISLEIHKYRTGFTPLLPSCYCEASEDSEDCAKKTEKCTEDIAKEVVKRKQQYSRELIFYSSSIIVLLLIILIFKEEFVLTVSDKKNKK